MQGIMILVLLFSLVVAVFAVQNAIAVPITFLTWHFETSLVFVILIATALGALILGLLGLFKGIKQGFLIKGLKNKVSQLSSEVEQLNAEITLARTVQSKGLLSTDLINDTQLTQLIAGTSPEILDSVSLVCLGSADLDHVREQLTDCAGFYALVAASEDEVTLIVDTDYWRTVEIEYPQATVEPGWSIIDFGIKVPKQSTGYLRAVLKVLDDVASKYVLISTYSTCLVAVPEKESLAVTKKLQVFATTNSR